jgi:hypothetical protein
MMYNGEDAKQDDSTKTAGSATAGF